MEEPKRTIGVLLFEGVEELDAVGPWEVLSSWTRQWPGDGWRVITIAQDSGPVECAKGLSLVAECSFAEMPKLDVLIYPGGQGTRAHLVDEVQLDWVRRQARANTLMASVCTGSLVFAAAGLLSNRPATTHWNSLDYLLELDPSIELRRDERFVDDGDIVTSSGVSAGIDMALHLVDRLAGRERAQGVRRYIQYDPQPPI